MTIVALPNGRRLRRQLQPGESARSLWHRGREAQSSEVSPGHPRVVHTEAARRSRSLNSGRQQRRDHAPAEELPAFLLPFASASTASRSAAAAALAARRFLRQPQQRQRLQRQLATLGASASLASSSAVDALQRGLSPLLLSSDGAISSLVYLLHSAGGAVGLLPGENDPGDVRPQLQEQALRLLRNRKVARVQVVPGTAGLFGVGERKAKTVTTFYTEEDFKCPVCFELLLRPVVTPCLHVFCRDCMLAVLLRTSMCPLCRGPVYAEQLEPVEESSSEKIVDFSLNYNLLPVTCTQCYWQGPLSSWTSNHNARRCRRIARHLRRTDPIEKH
ncbi:putative RING zinc finger protein, partial [Toxoplasma gondii FOU]